MLLEQQDEWWRRVKIVCTAMVVGMWGYDLLAFPLERPFKTPPRRMERVPDFDLGLDSRDELATRGVAVAGCFLFLR